MKKLLAFFHKNEKWLTPVVLIGGFILDNLTLRRSDLLIENILLLLYFVVLMSALLLFHKLQSRLSKSVQSLGFESFLFLVIQFIFGGLFSALTVFYIKSASFFASWPFLLVLFGGMIATEYFKKHFNQFLVQLTALYLLLFTYSIVLVPLIVRSIGTIIFLLSGIVSLVLITGYLFLFQKTVPQFFVKRKLKITGVIVGVFVMMNFFYVSDLIPPIPLALKESGVYKSVVRTNDNYAFSSFESDFAWLSLKQEYDIPKGSSVSFYSSIYAPIKFEQFITHEWQKKNSDNKWTTVSRVRFPIYGGRESGYRGYSTSSQVTKGEWRVLVKINSGQILGGETFLVK